MPANEAKSDAIPSAKGPAPTSPQDPGSLSPNATVAGDIEYDRRGLALPRRFRIGGIITPQ